MSDRAIVVPPGEGQRVGNVEFLARTVDTSRFTLGIIDFAPGRTMEQHAHDDEDDAFYILEGELTFNLRRRGRGRAAGNLRPGPAGGAARVHERDRPLRSASSTFTRPPGLTGG